MELPQPTTMAMPAAPRPPTSDEEMGAAMRELDVKIQQTTDNMAKQAGMALMLVVLAAARLLRANPGGGNRQRLRKNLVSDLEKRLQKYLKQ